MMWPSFTTTLLFSAATGLLSAFLAHRRGNNPYLWFAVGFCFGMLGALCLFFAPKKKKFTPPPAPIPQPYLSGPLDKFWYYLDPSHTQVGPMSHTAISKEWQEGKIPTSTLVWHEELAEWQPLADLVKTRL